MGEVSINSVRYVLAEDEHGQALIHQTYVQRLGQSIRLTGVQQRDQDTSVNRFIFTGFPLGIGWARMDRRNGRGVGGLRDATCDTRFKPVTLGRLHESQTHTAPADIPKAFVTFNNDLWGLFEEVYASGAQTRIVAREWQPDSWAGGGTVIQASTNPPGARAWDLVMHKGALYALTNLLTNATEQRYGVYRSPTGVTWTGFTNGPFGATNRLTTAVTRQNNFDDNKGKLLDYGDLLLAAMRDDVTNNNIEVFSSGDATDPTTATWTSRGTTSDSRVMALLTWRDPTDLSLRIPILVTERNVYKINTAAATLTALLPDGILTGDANDGRGAVVGLDGHLYLPLGSGEILKVSILGENALKYSRIGPPGDGFVTARRGHVNKLLVVPEPWLIVAYGGHTTGQDASIFAVDYEAQVNPDDGKEYQPWHSLYQHATAIRDIYLLGYATNDDAIPRLFMAVETESPMTTAAVMQHIEEPFTHPNASTTIKYQASSILRLPQDSMHDPQTVSTIYRAFVDADALGTASTERIQLQAGLNYAADTDTTPGTFIAGTPIAPLQYGTNGVRASRINQRLNFARGGTNTLTPLMYEFEYWAQAILLTARAWDFTIDLEKTKEAGHIAETATLHAQEVAIANIQTLATDTSATTDALFPFQYSQEVSAVRARIPSTQPPDFNLRKVGDSSENLGWRTGFIKIRLEEVTG